MLEYLKNEFNETTTTNNAKAFISTKSYVLDLFSKGGAMRSSSDSEIVNLFSDAFNENSTLSLKTLFYLRDIRGGQGERRFFKLCLKRLAETNKTSLIKNLHLISEFGRWDDLLILLDTPAKNEVVELIKKQLDNDLLTDKPSLLAKWLPSINASSNETIRLAKILIKSLNLTPRKYRKMLVELRKKINIVETHISNKDYISIDYSKIPSKASMKYREAFYRNDSIRYKDFLDNLSEGVVKINSSTLYPNDIVGKILEEDYHYYGMKNISKMETMLFEGMWNNLPNMFEDVYEDSLVMADVSGSMYGKPIGVSIGLAMYIAERNKGVFHNNFMTFSSNPSLVEIKGENIVEKVCRMIQADWGMTTDINKALEKIAKTAYKNGVKQEDMVKRLYIISDMQFDEAVNDYSNRNKTNFEKAKLVYENLGYELPEIVFWNVNAHSNSPVTMNELGVKLVSGYSPFIIKNILKSESLTPYEFMLETINSDRYKDIVA